MMLIYEETEIRERKEELNKFNKYANQWEKNFRQHIEILLEMSKLKNIELKKIKEQLRKTFHDILDEYHEIEKYHEL